mmetsp:Transcript_44982/g.140907  ORF Transcript_44982/g.140907 Transcript_44982/m.140907 type:complete len:1068 (-) Transcript_44982:2259-5462(-)
MAEASSFSKLSLRVTADLHLGQTLHVSGSSATMGRFNVQEAPAMVTTPEEFPVWRTLHPLVVPRGVVQTYKYCVFEGGKFKRWEKLPIPGSVRKVFVDEPLKEVDDALNHATDDVPQAPSSPRNLQEQLRLSGVSGESGTTADDPSARASVDTDAATTRASTESAGVNIPEKHLTLVCFHLPVELEKDGEGRWQATWAESLISKTEDSISDSMNTRWVGTVSYRGRDGGELSSADQKEICDLLRPMNCFPVFIGQHLRREVYKGFCKQVVWPAFHNVDSLDSNSAVWRQPSMNMPAEPESDVPEQSVGGGRPTAAPREQGGFAVPSRTPSPRPRLNSEDLSENFYDTYVRVNEIFLTSLVRILGELQAMGGGAGGYESGIVWVHDYHLMLLPKLLGDAEMRLMGERRSKIVFFLHIPFPTSQIFRTLSCGEALLQGMVSADVVGFHAFDHARHFLNACKRILGLQFKSRRGGLLGVEYQGRVVMVVMSHVGIEPGMLDRALAKPATQQHYADWQSKYPGRTIISGYDPCERLQGVALKLLAFEKLMDDYPLWSDKVVLVQRCVKSGSRPGDEEYTSNELRELVARINGKHGAVVDYAEVTKMDLGERLGLYMASSIFLALAVREGLNLQPLEFIYSHQDQVAGGVVIASEFSACTSMLSGILRVNPFHLEGTVQVLDQALAMNEREKKARLARDLPFVKSRPSALWTKQVLEDMAAVSREEAEKDDVTDMELSESVTSGAHTTGGAISGYAPLDPSSVISSYANSRSRVFLLDYGGTLLKKEELGKYLKRDMTACKSRTPNASVFRSLDILSRDPRNLIMIVSSLQRDMLESIFAAYPQVGLGASNGHSFSWPERLQSADRGAETPDRSGRRQWEVFDYGVDWTAVTAKALPIMERYTWHTNGATLSLRSAGIEWSYYSTDPEWGSIQASKMMDELTKALAQFDVSVHHNRGMIEVVQTHLNKGLVAKFAMEKVNSASMFEGDVEGRSPEFVLVVGDDASDEHMFRALYNFMGCTTEPAAPFPGTEPLSHVYTVSVGMRPTNATRYVTQVDDVEDLLASLAREAEAS